LDAHDAGEAGTLIEAVVAEHAPSFGLTTLRSPAGALQAPRVDLPIGTPVRVRIRARDVMIATARPDGLSALNLLPGRVTVLDGSGEGSVAVGLDCGGVRLSARLTRKSVDTLRLGPRREGSAGIQSVVVDRASLGRAPAGVMAGADRRLPSIEGGNAGARETGR